MGLSLYLEQLELKALSPFYRQRKGLFSGNETGSFRFFETKQQKHGTMHKNTTFVPIFRNKKEKNPRWKRACRPFSAWSTAILSAFILSGYPLDFAGMVFGRLIIADPHQQGLCIGFGPLSILPLLNLCKGFVTGGAHFQLQKDGWFSCLLGQKEIIAVALSCSITMRMPCPVSLPFVISMQERTTGSNGKGKREKATAIISFCPRRQANPPSFWS